MKYFYKFIFIFCLSFAGKTQINSYLNNNPCWKTQSMCEIAQTCYTVNVYNYFTNGDTLINSYQYKKIYKKGYSYAQYGAPGMPPAGNPCLSPPPTYFYGPVLSFFIRSAGKKMYALNIPAISGPCNGDSLLYDFGLNVGDTLPTTCINPASSTIFKVTAIDSINTLNGWMRRFKLNGGNTFDLIEGMGYKNGLIELMPPNVVSCGWNLQCYSQDNTSYYPSNGPSCMLTTTIQENKDQAQKPVVYPNPSSGVYKIYFTESDAKIEVRNVIGQLLQSHLAQSNTFEIDLSKETSGVYILNCIDKQGETRSVKLLKN